MAKKRTRNYDDEFKSSTVSLYYSSGKSYGILSKELNVPSATIAGWVHSGRYGSRAEKLAKVDNQPLLTELQKLRKELGVVKEERDILKKAVAIFS